MQTALFAAGCSDSNELPPIPPKPEYMPNTGVYDMADGVISQESLNNYLSRAVTQAEFLASPGLNTDGMYGTADDERMLLDIGAKFIGRSIYSWGKENLFESDGWLSGAEEKIGRMHGQDPDMIFQAALFEIVTTKVNEIRIPEWVFEEFDLEPVQRNFHYDDMKGSSHINEWGNNTCVPDITKREAQMFFFYMAVKYMDIGIEAFHCGQVMLMASMGDSAVGYASWAALLSRIRKAALTHARRSTVLLDGHLTNGGIVADGKLLFDFTSFPLRPKEVAHPAPLPGEAKPAVIERGYAGSIISITPGGITPSNWYASRAPYILEFDNFGISGKPGTAIGPHYVWGWDEITWLYSQPVEYQRGFLEYAFNYMKDTDPTGYIQMPGARICQVSSSRREEYHCNTRSEASPDGQSTEETIKRLWKE